MFSVEMKWLVALAFTRLFGHSGHDHDHANQHDHIKMAKKEEYPYGFQVPLHYPKYSKADYESMDGTRLDLLLREYGLSFEGTLDEKRAFAMGSFLWPHQL
ncbi:PREDICTED: uncharacterized protein LOC104811655 [Tarenaya hassleriana]|uniref:uncharacterized protein LOC104811655 n=1 Tax=Tarenaya hassleriana TaxID=28532 RepID=UPI00053C67EF|nr:PREDICTED: uncharacterized protein LOC104811655 [Tarenaya hassleriana]